jgi:carbon-monoxide dehydrogenase medium subunit
MAKLSGLYRPSTLPEALSLLAEDPDAKPISGGATLVAMMNAHVIEPDALVSLAAIEELRGISEQPDGTIRIGAFTRHRETAADARLKDTLFLVRDAASQIANAVVRNMGTIGGSIAFADPGLDYPPALVTANAEVELASAQGTRRLPVQEFFVDWYATALEPGEIVSAVVLPKPQPGVSRYHKVARVSGDYAIASLAISRAASGAIRIAVGACGPNPIHSDEVDQILSKDTSTAGIARAAEILVGLADPVDDVRASAAYRRTLIPRLLERAVGELEKVA